MAILTEGADWVFTILNYILLKQFYFIVFQVL
jgi:hypothetical protein